MESFNQNLANQMLTILNTLNENIINLGGMLKTRGLGVEMNEKDNDDTKLTEELMDVSKSFMDHSSTLN